jgi:hypothetical protein
MSWLYDLRVFPLFEFYLALVFLVSTWLRLRQYGAILALVRRFSWRWPNLLKLVRGHVHIFLTWGTVLPLLLVLGLLLLNYLARSYLWPSADRFTVGDLLRLWPALGVVGLSGLAMLVFDGYSTYLVGEVEQAELEKNFDQAEFWLRSWGAPVIRFFTLGYIHPRQMVAGEVRAALESASQLLNTTLWWVVVQTGLRIAFGLSLWLSFALQPWLLTLAGA